MSKQSGWRIKQIVWPDAVAPVRKTGPDWLNPNLLTRREVVRIVCWLGGIWLGWQIAAGLPRELERDGGQWRAVATEVHTAEGVARDRFPIGLIMQIGKGRVHAVEYSVDYVSYDRVLRGKMISRPDGIEVVATKPEDQAGFLKRLPNGNLELRRPLWDQRSDEPPGMVTIEYQREQNHQTIFDLVGWR